MITTLKRTIKKVRNVDSKVIKSIQRELAIRLKDFVSNIEMIEEPAVSPSQSAKDRLKMVLKNDRCKISPKSLTNMKKELIRVISKYVEIDKESLNLSFENASNSMALVANIPMARRSRA